MELKTLHFIRDKLIELIVGLEKIKTKMEVFLLLNQIKMMDNINYLRLCFG